MYLEKNIPVILPSVTESAEAPKGSYISGVLSAFEIDAHLNMTPGVCVCVCVWNVSVTHVFIACVRVQDPCGSSVGSVPYCQSSCVAYAQSKHTLHCFSYPMEGENLVRYTLYFGALSENFTHSI